MVVSVVPPISKLNGNRGSAFPAVRSDILASTSTLSAPPGVEKLGTLKLQRTMREGCSALRTARFSGAQAADFSFPRIGRSTCIGDLRMCPSGRSPTTTRSMSSEYRDAGTKWTLGSTVPPRMATCFDRKPSSKMAFIARQSSKSCST